MENTEEIINLLEQLNFNIEILKNGFLLFFRCFISNFYLLSII